MSNCAWVKEFPGAITVVDREGIILNMNDKAVKTFQDYGGEKLIGTSVLSCHPEPARTKLQELLETGQQNVYTIEKKGTKKLIFQTPWYQEGKYNGLVELSLEIPLDLPHFIR
ncbi:PAS domain S-box protein [bacterium]|nr:PAS domain S-box protein [bacterium]